MNKMSTGYKIFTAFNILFMLGLAVVMLYPYLHTLAQALNDATDTQLGGLTIWPRQFTMANIMAILRQDRMINAFIISVARVVVGTVIALVVQFGAAYAFVKKDLFGRRFFLLFLTIPMFISGGLIPQYILFSRIGLLNNFFVYILPTAFSFFNMVIIRTYLNTIPISLEESAKIDGANEMYILARIIFPLSMPIVATILLWVAVGHWNDWTTTLFFVTNRDLHVMQFTLMQTLRESERIQAMIREAQMQGIVLGVDQTRLTPNALIAAQTIVTTIPVIIIYPFLQKYFLKGVMIGSVKE